MDWPDRFPDGCPPSDAEPAGGIAYYLTHNPFRPRDFWSKRERNPDKRFSDPVRECRANGLSIFRDIEDARQLRRRVSYFRNRAIAIGKLTPDLGVTKATPTIARSSHGTWWVPIGVDRAQPFEVLEE